MNSSLRFVLFFVLVGNPVVFLTSCGPDTPPYPVHIRGNFAEAAQQVVDLIEKAHEHQLIIGEELPKDAVDRLRTYTQNSDEEYIAENIHYLQVIVYEDYESLYHQCDVEIKQVLRSRLMPKDPFKGCT